MQLHQAEVATARGTSSALEAERLTTCRGLAIRPQDRKIQSLQRDTSRVHVAARQWSLGRAKDSGLLAFRAGAGSPAKTLRL